MFSQKVMKTFQEYLSGHYDDEVTQKVLSLLEQLDVDDQQITQLIDAFSLTRPYFLHACLTTEVGLPARADLFAPYAKLSADLSRKHGHTFDSTDIRQWFDTLAKSVLAEIERLAAHV